MDYEMARRPETWLIALAGLAWFACGADGGLPGILAAALPGALLLTAATATAFFPGDRRIPRTGATGALIGLVFAVPLLFYAPLNALLLGALSALAGLAAARLTAEDLALAEDQPLPELDLRVSAQIALDESVLGTLTALMGVYNQPIQSRVGEELEAQLDWLRAGGWLDAPAEFHETPPPLGPVSLANRHSAGLQVELMRYASEFEPRRGAPGRERWLGYSANRDAGVRIVRSSGSRDWLICIHGLGMGRTWFDLYASGAARLHAHGLNLALPVLPLHGSRALGTGIASGKGFMVGDIANTLHALTQTVWDIRRLIAWLREEGAERIGVYGMSLGGYSAALVASLEDGLDCVIAGIPATEFGELAAFHASSRARWLAEEAGITPERVAAALTPVAPLVLQPRVALDKRFIFGGLVDRFVPPPQVEALWRHWGEPEIHWFPGSHLGFRLHHSVRDFVDRALDATLQAPR
jgi:pimeloyl-ACP methyl ester carboxylesterase